MDWKEKMRQGMKLIQEACLEDSLNKHCCHDCPFGEICDVLVDTYWNNVSQYGAPDTWDI